MRETTGKLVLFSLVCALFLGGMSGMVAGLSVMPHPPFGLFAPQPSGSVATNAAASPSITVTAAATDTPVRSAPTNTPLPTGMLDLQGRIAGIPAANQFPLALNGGGTITVVVSSQTTYEGAAASFSQLSREMLAEVKGTYQSSTLFSAILVNAQLDN